MPATREKDTRPVWTAERLQRSLETLFDGESIVVLANREPFRHDREPAGNIVVRRSAGGLVTALEPLIRACSGVWVAHGAGTADRAVVDWRDGAGCAGGQSDVQAPARLAERRRGAGLLLRVCERRPVAAVPQGARPAGVPVRRLLDVRGGECTIRGGCLRRGGQRLAAGPRAGLSLRARAAVHSRALPRSTIVAFWHIPWPHWRDFEICPWGRQLLDGLLGSSVVGFQTALDCRNFAETAERVLASARRPGRRTSSHTEGAGRWCGRIRCRSSGRAVGPPARRPSRPAARPSAAAPPAAGRAPGCRCRSAGLHQGRRREVPGGRAAARHDPGARERFVFVQIAEPSRGGCRPIASLRARVAGTANRINRRFGTARYRPIVFLEARHEPADVYRFLRAADLCYVGSLHDGMNLVAKEFVCARETTSAACWS